MRLPEGFDTLFYTALVIGAVYLFLRIFILSTLAKLNLLFNFRKEGKIEFLKYGEELRRPIYIPRGFRIATKDGECWIDKEHLIVAPRSSNSEPCRKYDVLMESEARDYKSILEQLFGVVWIGFTPFKLHSYEFSWQRQPKPTDPTDKENKNRFEVRTVEGDTFKYVQRTDYTTYLALKEVYAFVALDLELQGQTTVHIWGTVTIQAFNVYEPIFRLSGRWFQHVMDAATGAVGDYCRELSLKDFRGKEKGKMGSDLENCILETRYGNTGTIAVTGMGIVAFNFGGWQVSKESAATEEAAKAAEIATLRAQAIAIDAGAEAGRISAIGKATADAGKQLADALRGSPEAAMVAAAQEMRKGLEASKPQVLSIGGSGIPAIVNIPEKKTT